MHEVERPGPMETGRLHDINGDGRLDILPNGQPFASWWELNHHADTARPSWIRHELPPQLAGHGLGCGDINGDGRADVVGHRGWAEAPEDADQRWRWHAEFQLGRASVPILVADVDGDGDQDLIWSRAHAYGLHWLEQTTNPAGMRSWEAHTIDTSWSQCHAPLWADLDHDGTPEIIAGKRYLAHEGRDSGAYDGLVAYRYQFDRQTRTWQRWPITEYERVGFGLDPKVVDLDDDDDLDLVVCGRSGLYWLENTGPAAAPRAPAAASVGLPIDGSVAVPWQDPLPDRFAWGSQRRNLVAQLQRHVGHPPQPQERVPLQVRLHSEQQTDHGHHRVLSYQISATQRQLADVWIPSAAQNRHRGYCAWACPRPPPTASQQKNRA